MPPQDTSCSETDASPYWKKHSVGSPSLLMRASSSTAVAQRSATDSPTTSGGTAAVLNFTGALRSPSSNAAPMSRAPKQTEYSVSGASPDNGASTGSPLAPEATPGVCGALSAAASPQVEPP